MLIHKIGECTTVFETLKLVSVILENLLGKFELLETDYGQIWLFAFFGFGNPGM